MRVSLNPLRNPPRSLAFDQFTTACEFAKGDETRVRRAFVTTLGNLHKPGPADIDELAARLRSAGYSIARSLLDDWASQWRADAQAEAGDDAAAPPPADVVPLFPAPSPQAPARTLSAADVINSAQPPSRPGLADQVKAARLKAMAAPRAAPNPALAAERAAEALDKSTAAAAPIESAQAGTFAEKRNPSGMAPSLDNTVKAIIALGIECRLDEFHDKINVSGSAIERSTAESLDNTCLLIRTAIMANFGFDPGERHPWNAVRLIALRNRFDPVVDYLAGLRWDGKPRLDRWLSAYFGAADSAVNRAISRKVLIAAVRRARQPGCKFDNILVLDSSKQGTGKSTAIRILAGEGNFSDAEILGLDARAQQEQVQGVWFYELQELAGLGKAETEQVKAFASKQVDSARPAYATARVDRPRRCIFIGTTNSAEYLKDPTGNRRFWPVTPGPRIDLAGLRADRDQLFAEAAAAETEGESLTISEELWTELETLQRSRMVADPWQDVFARFPLPEWNSAPRPPGVELVDNEWRISSEYLIRTALDIPPARQSARDTRRVSVAMTALGWTGPKPIRFSGTVRQGYTKAHGPAFRLLDVPASELPKPEADR